MDCDGSVSSQFLLVVVFIPATESIRQMVRRNVSREEEGKEMQAAD